MKKIIIMSGLILIGAVIGFGMSFWSHPTKGSQLEISASKEMTLEERAEEAWMDGCVRHTVEEAQKMSDVVNEKTANAKASIFCACDWNYMRDSMGLSLEDIASIGQGGFRGSSAIVEAQNYCLERYKGGYYQ